MTRFRAFTSLVAIAALLVAATPLPAQQIMAPGNPSALSHVGGSFYATAYSTAQANVLSGTAAAGTSIIVTAPSALADGTQMDVTQFFHKYLLGPVIVDYGQGAQETQTPTSISYSTCPSGNLGVGGSGYCATITVSGGFTNAHGQMAVVKSGDYGLSQAVAMALLSGGGTVVVDSAWASMGGTDTMIAALLPYANVSIRDERAAATQYWNVTPAATALTAAPTTLTGQAACDGTHTFCSDASVAGSASWGGTVIGCITLVDIMGNESPCSATNSFTSVASKAIDIGAPAAVTTQIVGWKPYLSLSGGSYPLAYSLPLLTQPTVLQAIPVSSGVCTLTKLETVTPACAIANATYGQAASAVGAAGLFTAGGAQFTTYPVVTNTLAPEIGSASALQHNPNMEAHSTYKYVPSGRVGISGVQSSHIVFPITAAAQTTIGQVVGSFPLPASFMNYVGRTIEICGTIVKTSTTADTIDEIQLWWDAEGSNVSAGTPVQLSSIKTTEATALAAAANFTFCQQLTTTVAAATATGGTITPGLGWSTVAQVAAGANPSAGVGALVAAVGSLNLALPAHISVELKHTTGTDGAGATLQGATLRVVN